MVSMPGCVSEIQGPEEASSMGLRAIGPRA